MNNKKLGNRTEKMFLDIIQAKRGWACLIPTGIMGQPIDVTAMLKGVPIYVDVKHCAHKRFNFSAIQPNQVLAMAKIWEASDPMNRRYRIRIGFVIYFAVLKEWKFYSYGDYLNDSGNGLRSILSTDNRLETFDI